MKKFKEPELEVAEFEVEDIMTGSTGDPTVPPTSDEDEGAFQPFNALAEKLRNQ